MSNLFNSILTSALTIFGSVLVFAMSQLLQKFLVDPVHEQSKVIGEIFFGLVYYANFYANPGRGRPEDLAATSDAFRRYASQLQGTTHAIRCYNQFERWGLIPQRSKIEEAVRNLIRISNSIHSGDGRENSKDAESVKTLLTLLGRKGRLAFPWRQVR